jgi:hypothetical protein
MTQSPAISRSERVGEWPEQNLLANSTNDEDIEAECLASRNEQKELTLARFTYGKVISLKGRKAILHVSL